MSADAGQLLKKLEPAVRPNAGEPASPARARTAAHPAIAGATQSDLPFADLIDLAMKGKLSTGRPITVAPGIDVPKIQLEQIAPVADRAEAAGSQRAIVLYQRRAYLLDVPARKITQAIENGRLDPFAVQQAKSAGVRLDNPSWIVRADEVARASEATQPLAFASAAPADSSTYRMARSDGGSAEMIHDIDTAIFMNTDDNADDQDGDDSARIESSMLSGDHVLRALDQLTTNRPMSAGDALNEGRSKHPA